MQTKNKLKVIISVIIIVIVLVIIYFIIQANLNGRKNDLNNNETTISQEEKFRDIRLDEELNIEGTINGLKNARYNHARIMQYDKEMEFSIDIDNDSKDEVIPASELVVNILDKKGKTILTKNVQMEEISSDYGYTRIELEFDIDEPVIVYDIEIIANSSQKIKK